MKKIVRAGTVLLLIFTAGAMINLSTAEKASAQSCSMTICKSAPGAPPDLGFTINFGGDLKPFSVELFDGADCFTTSISFNSVVEVTEEPTSGWPLQDVVCDDVPGFPVSNIRDGISANCAPQSGFAEITCTFVNGVPPANIPTLSEWGMIAAAAGLMLVGVFFAVRKRLRASKQSGAIG